MAAHYRCIVVIWLTLVMYIQGSSGVCGILEFTCNNGKCVSIVDVCDRFDDCGDVSDEYSCGLNYCLYDEMRCGNGKCIKKYKKCDFIDDCGDNSDEMNCSRCSSSEYQCSDLSCIDISKICDGSNDCNDWLDETSYLCGGDCSYTPGRYRCGNDKCISRSYICDGDNDCDDYSDETNCTYCTPLNNNFLCENKRCIPRFKMCDSRNDCGDFSDELDPSCRETFYCNSRCKNGKCMHSWEKCNGQNDCGDFTDEENCTICRRNQFSCSNNKCIPLAWRCDGQQDCQHGEDERYCGCEDKTHFRCGSGDCITYDQICDSKNDCDDGSDEINCLGTKYHGRYGPGGIYDCNCKGECHPVTGTCMDECKTGWTGPSCQIEKVFFQTPKQRDGRDIVDAPASVDGKISTCPVASIGLPNAFWEANFTESRYLKRMRIYNKKDTTNIANLPNTFRSSCTWNTDFDDVGRMDVACNVTIKTNTISLIVKSSEETLSIDSIPKLQICEFQLISCSKQAFGVQCQQTCNCKNGEQCDDVTGQCTNGCRIGWTGSACDTSHNTIIIPHLQSTSQQVPPSQSSSCHCSDVIDCDKNWCYKGCLRGWQGMKCDIRDNEFRISTTTTSTSVIGKGTNDCHCLSKVDCKFVYFECQSGCEDGWEGNLCDKKQGNIQSWQILLSIAGVITVAVVVTCIIFKTMSSKCKSNAKENTRAPWTTNASLQPMSNIRSRYTNR